MLKNLLKYEFRATARTYGGIYLALLAAAGLIGFSFRGDRVAAQSHVFEIGVTIYSLLVMALVIVTIVTVIQRFTKNLLGREGYLMHTLPVTEAQLVGSKLISSAVWLLASAVVVLRTMLDDTYKSADDIRKYTGMVVLASIPLADAGEQPKEKSEFKRRTKRFANDVRRRVGGSSGRKA